ncbi:MAG TPA: RNA polymerase sigma-70 factor [Bacteroidales bacterium]|nr:RNA polymerase sigma-70 factor [Bacteroidales bacterium]
MSKSKADKDLIFKVATGDSVAFKDFYDLYSDKVYQFSFYFIKHAETCEEVVSDVFLNIWNNKERLPEIENLEGYLYIITRNKTYNYIDKEARIPESTSDFSPEIQIENTDPEAILLTKELEATINISIQELPERCRIIFLMSREDKMKYHEIAEILSISEKTVHAQIVTALKKLNAALKRYLYIVF